MDGNEIRLKIIENNKIIESVQPSTFILNKAAEKALQENRHLREICKHEYNDLGYCIYCDIKRD